MIKKNIFVLLLVTAMLSGCITETESPFKESTFVITEDISDSEFLNTNVELNIATVSPEVSVVGRQLSCKNAGRGLSCGFNAVYDYSGHHIFAIVTKQASEEQAEDFKKQYLSDILKSDFFEKTTLNSGQPKVLHYGYDDTEGKPLKDIYKWRSSDKIIIISGLAKDNDIMSTKTLNQIDDIAKEYALKHPPVKETISIDYNEPEYEKYKIESDRLPIILQSRSINPFTDAEKYTFSYGYSIVYTIQTTDNQIPKNDLKLTSEITKSQNGYQYNYAWISYDPDTYNKLEIEITYESYEKEVEDTSLFGLRKYDDISDEALTISEGETFVQTLLNKFPAITED